ncbi:MAG: hypothetical protein AABX44_02075 [Nanoarchaeota archaeon]
MVKKAIKREGVSSGVKLELKGNLEMKLIENFVSLQKVMTNLSVKFDDLSSQISKLLELFELSATALAKKDINFTKPLDEEKIVNKLNNILEQNKTIARGLALMSEGGESVKAIQPAMPQFRQSPSPSPMTKGEERYQKSPFKGF